MKMISSTFKLTLILYLCAALSGVYVFSASARITPKEGDEETRLITIEKGDTLWDLCEEYLEDPLRWRELSKYNDFTNPDLIYPGEKLRIPLAMIKVMGDDAEEKAVADQAELEKLRTELAESEATREKLMAEIEGLNASTAKLEKQIKALEASLKSQEKLLTAFQKSSGEAAADVKKVVRSSKNALQKQLQELNGNLESTEGKLSDVQKNLNAIQEQIGTIQGDVKTVLAQIEVNQKAINEIHMILKDAQGVHEEVSSTKRTLVFLTTVAAGIGWFALNIIGARSGE